MGLVKKGRNQRIIIYIDRRNPDCIISENECDDYIKHGYGQNKIDENESVLSVKLKKMRSNDTTKNGRTKFILFSRLTHCLQNCQRSIRQRLCFGHLRNVCYQEWQMRMLQMREIKALDV